MLLLCFIFSFSSLYTYITIRNALRFNTLQVKYCVVAHAFFYNNEHEVKITALTSLAFTMTPVLAIVARYSRLATRNGNITHDTRHCGHFLRLSTTVLYDDGIYIGLGLLTVGQLNNVLIAIRFEAVRPTVECRSKPLVVWVYVLIADDS